MGRKKRKKEEGATELVREGLTRAAGRVMDGKKAEAGKEGAGSFFTRALFPVESDVHNVLRAPLLLHFFTRAGEAGCYRG